MEMYEDSCLAILQSGVSTDESPRRRKEKPAVPFEISHPTSRLVIGFFRSLDMASRTSIIRTGHKRYSLFSKNTTLQEGLCSS